MSSRLPDGWTWATPPELAAPDRHALGIGPFGSDLKVSDYRERGVPLVFVRNIRSGSFDGDGQKYVSPAKAAALAAHEVRPGDVLITKMGDPPGDSALYPPSCPIGIVTADCIRWRVDTRLGEAGYFVYATRNLDVREQILGITRGVAQRKVSVSRFKGVRYPLPPLREQRRIVEAIESYFTRLDDAVATLERVQRNLKRYRASVLKAAVEGRLVPTEAELARAEGRDYEPASVLLTRILTERRRRWEESELAKMKAKGKGKVPKDDRWTAKYVEPVAPEMTDLPDLPEGWCWATVDQLAAVKGGITKGQRPKHGERYRQVPYLRVANVQRGFLDLAEMRTIDASETQIEELRLEPGDVLFNEGGDRDKLGRGWIWRGELRECIHQNHVFRARIYTDDFLPELLSWYGNTAGQQYFFDEGKQTTNLASINMTKLRGLPVPLPPRGEQQRIRESVEEQLSVADVALRSISAEVVRCARLRQSILKWAFEGRLVDQDPTDEPASRLLERIQAARDAKPARSSRTRRPTRATKGRT